MKKEITFFPIAVLLTTALVLSSCKDRQPLTLTISGTVKIDRKTTDNETNFFGTPLEDLFLSPLVAYDSSNTPHPVLLKEAKPMDGGRVWEVAIREGVRFHDGKDLTAADVAFSIDKRKDICTQLGGITRMEVLDKWAVRLTLKDPVRDISEMLSRVYVYPGHILKVAPDWRDVFLRQPIGSGPFKVEKWRDNGMEFTANESYFDGRPRIKRIVYFSENDENRRLTSLLKGDTDVIVPVSPKTAAFLEKDRKFHLNRQALPYFTALFLNTGTGVFTDLRARETVGLALDRDEILLKGIFGTGLTANSPFSSDMLPEGYTSPTRFYHPDEALELLEQVGWRPGKDGILAKNGKPLRIRLRYHSSDGAFRRVAEIIARQLYEIGIEVDTASVDYASTTGNSLQQLEYDAFLGGGLSYNPERIWQSRELGMDGTNNFSNYSRAEIDSLLELARKTKDPERRKRIYARMDLLIYEDVPALFLYSSVYYTAANKRFAAAKGFMGTPYETIRIKDW